MQGRSLLPRPLTDPSLSKWSQMQTARVHAEKWEGKKFSNKLGPEDQVKLSQDLLNKCMKHYHLIIS